MGNLFYFNITTVWILKFILNWVRCLICGWKFTAGFGHLSDIWSLTPKKSNHCYHHYRHDSNKFLLWPSRACLFFFLNHKTSIALKVQTRKSLLMGDSTLKHSAHVFLPLDYSVKKQQAKRNFAYETNGKCLYLLKCSFSGGKIALCTLNYLI